MKYVILAGFCLFLLGCGTRGQKTAVPESATILLKDSLQLLRNGFVFTEGPSPDPAGNIYFTDQPRNQIWKYDTAGVFSLFMENAGRSNGLFVDSAGNLLACADEENELWSISQTKQKTLLLKGAPGKAFNGPNDLWLDSRGGIYFTDPYYQRDYWTRQSPELTVRGLYYLPAGASDALLLDSSLKQPNGIVGTADGRYLYVADIGAGKTYRYRIAGAGRLEDRRLFVEQGSDGMTLDQRGNLYLSGKGVTIYNAGGAQIHHIEVPSKWVGNLCFGGPRHDLLFITASESVYALRLSVRGDHFRSVSFE